MALFVSIKVQSTDEAFVELGGLLNAGHATQRQWLSGPLRSCSEVTLNIHELRAEAKGGSVVAQAVLGVALLVGPDTERDPVEAFHWLSSASERGVPRAMLYLGTMYEEGLVVSADPQRARSLYEAAAERGEFYACVFLGRLLGSSKCGAADKDGALHWYRVARSYAKRVGPCPELEEARTFVNSRTRSGAG